MMRAVAGSIVEVVERISIQFAVMLAVAALSLSPCRGQAKEPASQPAKIDFDREVRPILADNCYECHGPDEKARKAKLRLDTREGAFRVRDGESVITPGKSAESELIKRITSTDPDEHMPPPDSNHKLTARQIELVKRWIDEGATWSAHWAFA